MLTRTDILHGLNVPNRFATEGGKITSNMGESSGPVDQISVPKIPE